LRGICTARTPCRDGFDQPRQQALVVADPLQRRIREDEIVALGRRPARDVADDELDAGIIAPRCRQHVGRAVEPGDRRFRPAVAQKARAVAGTAAEIDDTPRRRAIGARQEIERGLCALIGEAQVLLGIPTMH
jgi:hypothetical protein